MMMRQLRRMLPSDEQLPQRLRWLRMRTCEGFLRLTLLCQRATISGNRRVASRRYQRSRAVWDAAMRSSSGMSAAAMMWNKSSCRLTVMDRSAVVQVRMGISLAQVEQRLAIREAARRGIKDVVRCFAQYPFGALLHQGGYFFARGARRRAHDDALLRVECDFDGLLAARATNYGVLDSRAAELYARCFGHWHRCQQRRRLFRRRGFRAWVAGYEPADVGIEAGQRHVEYPVHGGHYDEGQEGGADQPAYDYRRKFRADDAAVSFACGEWQEGECGCERGHQDGGARARDRPRQARQRHRSHARAAARRM